MSKSSSCTIIICSKCGVVVQKEHTRTSERYKRPWKYKNGRPICWDCVEKILTKKN